MERTEAENQQSLVRWGSYDNIHVQGGVSSPRRNRFWSLFCCCTKGGAVEPLQRTPRTASPLVIETPHSLDEDEEDGPFVSSLNGLPLPNKAILFNHEEPEEMTNTLSLLLKEQLDHPVDSLLVYDLFLLVSNIYRKLPEGANGVAYYLKPTPPKFVVYYGPKELPDGEEIERISYEDATHSSRIPVKLKNEHTARAGESFSDHESTGFYSLVIHLAPLFELRRNTW